MKKIIIIHMKLPILHLFNLFNNGDKIILKNKDNISISITFNTLYKNKNKITNHIIINTFIAKDLYSWLFKVVFIKFIIKKY